MSSEAAIKEEYYEFKLYEKDLKIGISKNLNK